ncbi:hypothetical protein ACQJBY_036876 [Aegilops geniculata]
MRGRERRKERGGGRKREERGEGGVAAGVGLRRRGRARPGGWRRLDPFLDRELRGGWGSGAMHGRLQPASISTRAAATTGGARAATVVHGAGVGRRSLAARPTISLPLPLFPARHCLPMFSIRRHCSWWFRTRQVAAWESRGGMVLVMGVKG